MVSLKRFSPYIFQSWTTLKTFRLRCLVLRYTGEVNEFGVPNGNGRMRFKSGHQHDGQWANGYSEQYLDKSSRMKRGFAENRSPWKEDNGMTLAVPSRSEQPQYEYSSRSIHA